LKAFQRTQYYSDVAHGTDRRGNYHNPLGKVSSTSPSSHSVVRSSGSTARV
jgi:hypothetical protein